MSYELLIFSIAEVHARTQIGAAGAVNRYLTLRNWFIGAYVVQFEQNGADRATPCATLESKWTMHWRSPSKPRCSGFSG
jgi:hypothetical protein